MPRLTAIEPSQAEGKAREQLERVEKRLGFAPNMMRTLANAPAALDGYLSFARALAHGKLSAAQREAIALTVAGISGCDYCVAAHTMVGGTLDVEAGELAANAAGRSSDPGLQAILDFARAVVETQGWVSDEDIWKMRDAGFGEDVIVETVANVAENIFTNYINHVAETEIDFPAVPAGDRSA